MRKQNKSEKKNRVWWFVIIGVIVVGSAIGISIFNNNSTPAFPQEVTAVEASNLRNDGAFILDVREPDEWVAGHIPNATLIPLGELPARINEIPQTEKIVVVCRSGNRSATGRDILLKAGYDSVTSMRGGMNAWVNNGYEIVTGQ